MKRTIFTLTLLSLGFLSFQAIAAVKVVECEDEQGNRTFESACPPGTTMVDEKKIPTGVSADESEQVEINATLYSIAVCDSCDEVREFLQGRGVTITEKSVEENLENQTALKDLTGALRVPVTAIGENIITGYNRSELKAALEAAGYKEAP